MSWRQAVRSFLHSGTVLSMAGGLIATGGYVVYKDWTRYPRMMDTYARGNILPPMAENAFETVYFHRPRLEQALMRSLQPTFSNEYFLVNGDFGSGKTRTMVELIRHQIDNEGRMRKGAPIYVLANQGTSFPETLASAVNFHFDEHISFKFFVAFVMRINSMPQRDESNRLMRVLEAIELSSFIYMQKTGRPVVIVIDGIDYLSKNMPSALERLQEKAKLWADTNTVKMVFINNDEQTEASLQKNDSCWSRQATPISVEDLSDEEAVEFLTSAKFMEHQLDSKSPVSMPLDRARQVVDLVGGKIIYLIEFKRAWINGVDFEETVEEIKSRERESLLKVWPSAVSWRLISTLHSAPDQTVSMSSLIKMASLADVYALAKSHVIRYDRDPDKDQIVVTFRSRLTSHMVDEIQRDIGRL